MDFGMGAPNIELNAKWNDGTMEKWKNGKIY
jgi:hypothetical protein